MRFGLHDAGGPDRKCRRPATGNVNWLEEARRREPPSDGPGQRKDNEQRAMDREVLFKTDQAGSDKLLTL